MSDNKETRKERLKRKKEEYNWPDNLKIALGGDSSEVEHLLKKDKKKGSNQVPDNVANIINQEIMNFFAAQEAKELKTRINERLKKEGLAPIFEK